MRDQLIRKIIVWTLVGIGTILSIIGFANIVTPTSQNNNSSSVSKNSYYNASEMYEDSTYNLTSSSYYKYSCNQSGTYYITIYSTYLNNCNNLTINRFNNNDINSSSISVNTSTYYTSSSYKTYSVYLFSGYNYYLSSQSVDNSYTTNFIISTSNAIN